jgi:hypothetical protein
MKIDVNAFMETASWVNHSPLRLHTGFYGLFHNSFGHTEGFEGFAHKEICPRLAIHPGDVRTVAISGHSLGGAMATLAAYHWTKKRQEQKVHWFPLKTRVHLTTFGCPAVGNQTFVKDFLRQPIVCFNMLNRNDWVAQAQTWDRKPANWLKSQVVYTATSPKQTSRDIKLVHHNFKGIDWIIKQAPPESPSTVDWITGQTIPVYQLAADRHKFLTICRHQKTHPELKQLPKLYRYFSGSCFPPWPPVGRTQKYKGRRRLYDQYAPTVPPGAWSQILRHRPMVNYKVIKKAHKMKHYLSEIVATK